MPYENMLPQIKTDPKSDLFLVWIETTLKNGNVNRKFILG